MTVRKIGELERKNQLMTRKPEDEYWGEEAGRRQVLFNASITARVYCVLKLIDTCMPLYGSQWRGYDTFQGCRVLLSYGFVDFFVQVRAATGGTG